VAAGQVGRRGERQDPAPDGVTIKALPLWQPWASLVASGAKRVETRGYAPQRLGLRCGQRLAIHACKTDRDLWLCGPDGPDEFTLHIPFGFPDWDDLPLGAIVATCVLDRAREITAESAAHLERHNPQEFAFGHYAPGRWAWVLRDVERLSRPVPFRGSQGVFNVPLALLSPNPEQDSA
jgi:activating signal cointegrator 1